VETRLARLGGASLDLDQRVLRERQLLTRLDVRLALLDRDLRVARVPRALVGAFGRLLAPGISEV
jgi:acyl-CoA thioesterase FadM